MKGWVIFGVAFALYFVSIFGGFVQDDTKVIAGDPEMGTVKSLVSVWTRPYYYRDQEKSIYRPATSFSFYLNSLITGKGAWGFRLGNVLLYSWVCWLVYEVLIKLENSKKQKLKNGNLDNVWSGNLTFWAAMMFVVLPIHTEVVNNIVGRSEILSLGFLLLALLENFKKRWDVSALFLLLAMLSKETAVVGMPILIYLSLSNKEIDKNQKTASVVLVTMVLLGFMMMRVLVLGGGGMGTRATKVENPLKFVSVEKRVMNGISLIPFGIGKIIFPVNLSYDYSYNQIKLVNKWSDWRVVLGMVMFVLSGVICIDTFFRKSNKAKQSLVFAGMMFFWGPIFITGNILFPIGTIFGERLWFLSSLGVVLIAMLVGSKTTKNRTPALLSRPALKRDSLRLVCTWSVRLFGYSSAPIFIAILFLFAGRTFVRNLDWLSQERLFLHDAKYATESVMAQSNAAAMYLMKNDLDSGKEYMEIADKIYPKYPELLNNWGMYYLWTGDRENAVKKFEECLKERPGSELCKNNLSR